MESTLDLDVRLDWLRTELFGTVKRLLTSYLPMACLATMSAGSRRGALRIEFAPLYSLPWLVILVGTGNTGKRPWHLPPLPSRYPSVGPSGSYDRLGIFFTSARAGMI